MNFALYLATDPHFLAGRNLEEVVGACIRHGVTAVQLRDKEASGKELFETGRRLLAVTRRLGVPLLINDRLDVALALDADGVHLGRSDLPLAAARRLLGPGKLLGASCHTVEHLREAAAAGADHAGIGPVFVTSTKPDAAPALGVEGLRTLVASTHLPCVAIGGIQAENVAAVAAAGVAGVCVISAILGAANPAAAAAEIRRRFDEAAGNKPE